jgi:hypothetical protein
VFSAKFKLSTEFFSGVIVAKGVAISPMRRMYSRIWSSAFYGDAKLIQSRKQKQSAHKIRCHRPKWKRPWYVFHFKLLVLTSSMISLNEKTFHNVTRILHFVHKCLKGVVHSCPNRYNSRRSCQVDAGHQIPRWRSVDRSPPSSTFGRFYRWLHIAF